MKPPDRKPIVESLRDLVVAVSHLVSAVAATATSARELAEPIRKASARHKAKKKARKAAKAAAERKPQKKAKRAGRGASRKG